MNTIQLEVYNYFTELGYEKKYSTKIIMCKEGYPDVDIDNIKSIPDLIKFMINYTTDNMLYTAKHLLSKDKKNNKPIKYIDEH